MYISRAYGNRVLLKMNPARGFSSALLGYLAANRARDAKLGSKNSAGFCIKFSEMNRG